MNKRLFAKADFLVGKFLFCPIIKFSELQTSILHGVETRSILSDIAQQMLCKHPDDSDV